MRYPNILAFLFRIPLFLLAPIAVLSAAAMLSNPCAAGSLDLYGEYARLRNDEDYSNAMDDQWTWHLRYYLLSDSSTFDPYIVLGRDYFSAGNVLSSPRPYLGLGLRMRLSKNIAAFGDVVRAPIVCNSWTRCENDVVLRHRLLVSWEDQGQFSENVPRLRWSGYGEGLVQSTTPAAAASLWLRSTVQIIGDEQASIHFIPIEIAGDRAAGGTAWTHADARVGLFATMSSHGISTSFHGTRMLRESFLDHGQVNFSHYWRLVLTVGGYFEP